ncbi:MAG: long-chain fatty acid--CoA ligase [Dehalococcoidia bacterium]|nr:MAG: long-chain fatty acid--CoA ligase [Dehalococcoidia bacterium]
MQNAERASSAVITDSFHSVGDYISGQCKQWGQHPFVKELKTSLLFTYSEFWREIQWARVALDNAGVKPGERIGLAMENSVAALAMFMGALVAQVAPVIVSPKNKISEVKYTLDNCQATAFFIPRQRQDKYNDRFTIPVFPFGIGEDSPPTISPLSGRSTLDDTAYIVFTSGSTGTPKQVRVSHRNVLVEIQSMAEAYGFTHHDRHLCVLPIHHASGLYRNVLLPFHVGGYVALADAFQFDTFWRDIAAEQITFVQVVPSILRTLLMHEECFQEGQQKSLKFIGSASAPHPTELLQAFEERFGVYVLQGYGLTEATCGITLNPLNREEHKLGSAGRPLSVNKVTVWGDNDEVLPPGKVGNIVVSGENITTCSDAINTAKDSGEHSAEKTLDTGDIGYLDDDGFIWLEGRRSDMIKRGGYRISPNKIEDAISASFPNLEVVAMGVPHSLLGQDIIAFVSGERTAGLTSREIIRQIKGNLPSFMIPSEIFFVDHIPKFGTGKVCREKLLLHYYDAKGDKQNVQQK